MNKKFKVATGTTGFILDTFDGYVFRVYDKGESSFTDYDLRHSDLEVTIVDTDAVFYEYENGTESTEYVLDYSPKTLGYPLDNIKAGADINAGDGGYSIGTEEKYNEAVKRRNQNKSKE